jgi:hypothetical protein
MGWRMEPLRRAVGEAGASIMDPYRGSFRAQSRLGQERVAAGVNRSMNPAQAIDVCVAQDQPERITRALWTRRWPRLRLLSDRARQAP